MIASQLHDQAIALGLTLKPDGDRLEVFGRSCPPEFAEELRAHKAELLDWLSRPCRPGWGAVPPANLPLAVVMPRPTLQNRNRVLSYLLRQCPDQASPLLKWLVHRENDYYDRCGRHWDCALIAYAVARDAAFCQLSRSETQVRQFLEAIEKKP